MSVHPWVEILQPTLKTQIRTWADEFDNSTMEQKKMIACQLIREVKVSRGYELEIVFDLNYEQFLSL